MNGELPTSVLKSIIWGDDLELNNSDPDNEPNPFETLKHDGAVRAALGKSNGASCVLDLALPPKSDVDDDGELYKSPTIVETASARADRSSKRTRPAIAKTTTRVDDDGFYWSESFDAAGNLIDTRVLLSERT